MGSILENKVSNLMATVNELEKKIEKLNKTIEEKDQDKVELNRVIDKLEAKILEQRNEIVDQQNKCDDLRLKGGELSPVNFDKLNSQLNLANSEIETKDL